MHKNLLDLPIQQEQLASKLTCKFIFECCFTEIFKLRTCLNSRLQGAFQFSLSPSIHREDLYRPGISIALANRSLDSNQSVDPTLQLQSGARRYLSHSTFDRLIVRPQQPPGAPLGEGKISMGFLSHPLSTHLIIRYSLT